MAVTSERRQKYLGQVQLMWHTLICKILPEYVFGNLSSNLGKSYEPAAPHSQHLPILCLHHALTCQHQHQHHGMSQPSRCFFLKNLKTIEMAVEKRAGEEGWGPLARPHHLPGHVQPVPLAHLRMLFLGDSRTPSPP